MKTAEDYVIVEIIKVLALFICELYCRIQIFIIFLFPCIQLSSFPLFSFFLSSQSKPQFLLIIS
mgnify:CR=1 FL=1